MEIKKQKMSEAGMAHAKEILGPDQFKNNKAAAREICSHFVKGMKHMHILTEQELLEAEADKNLVLKHWDEAKQSLAEKVKIASGISFALKSKFKELAATGALDSVFAGLKQIEGGEVEIGK